MYRCILRAKIHMARVTDCVLHYEGSIGIDEDIIEAAGILPFEQVHVCNLNNGERFVTYVIPAERGSRGFTLNGPAARKAAVGDRIVIFAYSWMEEAGIPDALPRVLIMDEENRIAVVREGRGG